MTERIISVLLVAVVALGAMTGVAAADGDLGVAVDDTDGEPTVTVTANETAVENATVTVTAADAANESYAGTGEYTTDENGTIALPAPEENVTVDVTVSSANETASTTVDLTVADEADADRPFGQLVSEYIDDLADRSGGIGDAVSDFVTETNRGNAPDRAGGFDDPSDGPGTAPADAGPTDDERGPPDAPATTRMRTTPTKRTKRTKTTRMRTTQTKMTPTKRTKMTPTKRTKTTQTKRTKTTQTTETAPATGTGRRTTTPPATDGSRPTTRRSV
ncbi:MAG: hypothetical protein A07HR67_02564 [uncultured archaeon A07HR67]|nr:MAG: hypothetical protein A07HR67_02564 [uncultured archaeon A07HR67]